MATYFARPVRAVAPPRPATWLLTLCAMGLGAVGCAGLKLQRVDGSVRPPGNVAVYFTVDRSDGEPVPGLQSEQFRIYEDGRPVSLLESKQVILNREVAAVHYTLLLMDMSGSVTESGQVEALQAAAAAFSSRVEKYQRVAVYAFDGSPSLTPIVPFTASVGSASAGVAALARFHPRDPSTNLHGGVVEALRTLDRALATTTQPLKFGTLVVFTDGSDRAARVSRDEMMKQVQASPFDIFVIGVGAEIDERELGSLGRTGAVFQPNASGIETAFDEMARRVEAYTQRYYLLSYCSPARAGEHELAIEAIAPDGATGQLRDHFNATGFGPNCNPNTPPPFDTSLRSRRMVVNSKR